MDKLAELREYITHYGTAPTLAGMQRRTLKSKGIAGPTGAHVIEEVHTPFNLSYITVTTGTTAFQNLVGVTDEELTDRITASQRALELAGIQRDNRMLITYPPLVSVFPWEALLQAGVDWFFLQASGRDALVLALCEEKPSVVVGESAFMRAALLDAEKLGLASLLPQGLKLLAAGTPLDPELIVTARRLCGGEVHDLYGCQEFGWILLDGIPLRDDITLLPGDKPGIFELLVGGLSTGDFFPVLESGHSCNCEGKVITYSRRRGAEETETTVLETTASGRETVERLAKTILRIKAKIVRVPQDIKLGAERTVLSVKRYSQPQPAVIIKEKTNLFDSLLAAQIKYQGQSKTDPAWIKDR